MDALKETPDESFSETKHVIDDSVDASPENVDAIAPAIIEDVQENRIITDIERLAAADFVGIIFSTYIILQNEDICFIVDQHAAHESGPLLAK